MSKTNDWRGRGTSHDMWSRRNYLVATVGIAALSGCSGGPDDDGAGGGDGVDDEEAEEGDHEDEEAEELPPGVSEEQFESGPVPDVYLSARSLGGEERDPDGLNSKSGVQFSEYTEALEHEAHEPGRCCANCADFIPDKNGDGFGACAEVEGYIDGADWCVIFESLPEPVVPDGMSEDQLATAEVPEEYRTASSQTGEDRGPDELQRQTNLQFMESVEAIADGPAKPGQSCGNCAEFIPDKNGDGWGACAKVEGYIAVEDWCAIWEPISEEL